MELGFFTEEAYETLLHNVSVNKNNYLLKNDWIREYFKNDDYYKKSTSVIVYKFVPTYEPGQKSDEQKNKEDLINTRLLYDSFKNLTPLQASNKYMWTYLCHAIPEYYDYIRDRWMQNDRENTIETRFFVTNKQDSVRNDNALSRLWWYGHLTYDEENSNKYELTEILLMNQTICTDVMDTYNRMSFQRMKGILLAIKQFKDEIGENEGITEYFRQCKKYLNHYGAVTTLDYLKFDEIQKLAYDYMVKLRKSSLINGSKAI